MTSNCPTSKLGMSSSSDENTFQFPSERKKADIDVDLFCLLDSSLGSLCEVLMGVSPFYVMNVLLRSRAG